MSEKNKVVVRSDVRPVVNLESLPQHEVDYMCRTLIASVKELFRDPAVQEDFARWKAERAARAAREEAQTCSR